jgi:beta-galactosidase
MLADRSTIKADANDLSFITVKIVDKDGRIVPRSKHRLHVTVSGPGEVVAMDNGDATDLESFQSINRKTYNGLALVVIRSKRGQEGIVRLSVSSDGLTSSTVSIHSR